MEMDPSSPELRNCGITHMNGSGILMTVRRGERLSSSQGEIDELEAFGNVFSHLPNLVYHHVPSGLI